MSANALVLFFQVTSVAVAALAAAKVFRTGLYHRYRILFGYFIFYTLNGVWPLFVNVKSNLYLRIWLITEPVSFLFYILVVLELCRLVLEKHPGLYTLGRWAMYCGMVISITL